MSADRSLGETYHVWAKNKYDAIEKAVALATARGGEVYHVEAARFPEGKDYNVNWRVVVYLDDPA